VKNSLDYSDTPAIIIYKSFETTLLLPAEPTPIKIDVVDLGMALPSKIKKKIGFCGDISCSQ